MIIIASLMSLLVFSIPQDGITPLRRASGRGHEEVVSLLVKSGAKQTPDKVSEIQHCYLFQQQ